MQIICFSEDACFAKNLDSFIIKNNIKRVTGNFEIIKQLSILKSGNISMGSIFFLNNQYFLSPFEKYAAVKAVSYEEFIAIGGLLRKDESFYKNYKDDLVLGNQLYDRYKSKNGRSYYCCIGKEIVATASTYAESDSIAVISGVFTESKYKGKGIGTFLLSVLKNELINENKNIIIYFFDKKLTSFYERIGVYKKAICAKIEFFE